MKMQLKLFLISTFILVGASSITLAEGNHTIGPAPEIKWGPGPKAVPAGAQLAVFPSIGGESYGMVIAETLSTGTPS